jgi:GST-like protein
MHCRAFCKIQDETLRHLLACTSELSQGRVMLRVHVTHSPDAHKPLIAIEELGLAYDVAFSGPFTGSGAHAAAAPILTDTEDARFAVFSPAAALLSLAERGIAPLALDPAERTAALQWLGWEAAALGPLTDHVCQHEPLLRAPIDVAAARDAFTFLDRRLARAPFLLGAFGAADIGVWPWAFALRARGIAADDLVYLATWLDAIGARPAVQRAMAAHRRAVARTARVNAHGRPGALVSEDEHEHEHTPASAYARGPRRAQPHPAEIDEDAPQSHAAE